MWLLGKQAVFYINNQVNLFSPRVCKTFTCASGQVEAQLKCAASDFPTAFTSIAINGCSVCFSNVLCIWYSLQKDFWIVQQNKTTKLYTMLLLKVSFVRGRDYKARQWCSFMVCSQFCLDIKHCNCAASFKQTATVQTARRRVPNSCSNRYGRDQNQLRSKQESNPACLGNNLLITFKNLRRLMELNLRCWSCDNGRQKYKRLFWSGKMGGKKKVCGAKTKASLLTWQGEQREDEKKIAFDWSLFPSLCLSHAHKTQNWRQGKHINFYEMAEDTCEPPPTPRPPTRRPVTIQLLPVEHIRARLLSKWEAGIKTDEAPSDV